MYIVLIHNNFMSVAMAIKIKRNETNIKSHPNAIVIFDHSSYILKPRIFENLLEKLKAFSA